VNFVPFNYEDHGEYVKKMTRAVYCQDTKGIVAMKDGEPVGVMLCDMWTHNSVQAHIGLSTPMCLKHGMLEEFFNWVFNVCDRNQILGLLPSNNLKSIKLVKHLGFTELTRLPDAVNFGIDYVVFRMFKDECSYIKQLEEAA